MSNSSQATRYAYIDESGDSNIDLTKDGTSRYYVVAAVITDAEKELSSEVERIRSKYFGKGEMKSSGIGNKINRRIKILSALAKTKMKYCAFVADKSQISEFSGLRFRKSFIKYLHGRLYKRLYRAFSHLHVFADEHGRSEFMTSFERYLCDRYKSVELFDKQSFSFVPSESNCLVQCADIIAGTLQRVYSGKDDRELLNIISESAILIERWPPSSAKSDVIYGLEENEVFDHLVAQQGVMLARTFIKTNMSTSDQNTEAQVEALRYLFHRYELSPNEYIHAEPILEYVNQGLKEPLTLHYFRMNIIAKLRNEGVIIASSNKGYKIPNTTRDIEDFVAQVNGQVIPYLHRLASARDQLLLASSKNYDIVNNEKYPHLYECLKSFSG